MSRLLVLGLALLSVLSHASRIHPFTASEYYTKHKLVKHVVGDIAQPDVLRDVVEHKSWKKEGALVLRSLRCCLALVSR